MFAAIARRIRTSIPKECWIRGGHRGLFTGQLTMLEAWLGQYDEMGLRGWLEDWACSMRAVLALPLLYGLNRYWFGDDHKVVIGFVGELRNAPTQLCEVYPLQHALACCFRDALVGPAPPVSPLEKQRARERLRALVEEMTS